MEDIVEVSPESLAMPKACLLRLFLSNRIKFRERAGV
jgi:hypothetical protein